MHTRKLFKTQTLCFIDRISNCFHQASVSIISHILFLPDFQPMKLASHPTAAPAPPTTAEAAPDIPAAPADCKAATTLPAATPPPFATAATDIILAATEPAAIPAEVKPAAPRTAGAATIAPTAHGQEQSSVLSNQAALNVRKGSAFTKEKEASS